MASPGVAPDRSAGHCFHRRGRPSSPSCRCECLSPTAATTPRSSGSSGSRICWTAKPSSPPTPSGPPGGIPVLPGGLVGFRWGARSNRLRSSLSLCGQRSADSERLQGIPLDYERLVTMIAGTSSRLASSNAHIVIRASLRVVARNSGDFPRIYLKTSGGVVSCSTRIACFASSRFD